MIAAACALTLAGAALLIPVRVKLIAALTIGGGRGEVRIAWLFLRFHIPMQLHLLRGRKLHLDMLHKNGTVRKRIGLIGGKEPKSQWETSLRSVLFIQSLSAAFLIGVEGAPAATTLLCGAAESVATDALKILQPELKAQVRAFPVFSQSAFRLNLEGIARVRLGKLIRSRLRNRGEQKHGTSPGKHHAVYHGATAAAHGRGRRYRQAGACQ